MFNGKSLRRLHRNQAGSFSLSHLVATLFLAFGAICLLNVGTGLSDRTRLQRQADASATSLAVLKARYLNALIAKQHLMGEMLSIVIIHHAIGGDLLDADLVGNTRSADSRLRTAYRIARALGYRCPAYSNVSQPVLAGEALLESQIQLKNTLTSDYYLLVTAWILKRIPFTRPIGVALERVALILETAIHSEWRVLDKIRGLARSLTPFKKAILNALPITKLQLNSLIVAYPSSQRSLADSIERKFGMKIHILPTDRLLPIKEDPLARLSAPPVGWRRPAGFQGDSSLDMREQVVKVTQLTRATFPWVCYHRQAIVDSLRPVTPFSGMASKYFSHTVSVSKKYLDELQRDGQLALYVLRDYQGPDKAFESWINANGAGAADRAFGLTVLVGRNARQPIAPSMFDRSLYAYNYRIASAMVWNTHSPQQPSQRIDFYQSQITPSVQAQTGWDTLNWTPGRNVAEFSDYSTFSDLPAIQPGWQSSLCPTSPARLGQLVSQALPAWAIELRKTLPIYVDSKFISL